MAVKDLNSKTVTELKTLAKKAGVTIKSSWKKADLVKALTPAKSSSRAKKSLTKQKKQPATKKSAAKKTVKKALKKAGVKKTSVKKASRKSMKKVKKTAAKAVKKATAKTGTKKTTKKTLKKVQKKTSSKSTTKKTARTISGKSGTVTVKKTSVKKGQAAKSAPKATGVTVRKATSVRKSNAGKVRITQRAREKMPVSTTRAERKTSAMTKSATAKATRVSLLVVDPHKLFAFWEINDEDLNKMVKDGEAFSFLLRVYFFREGEQTGFFDVKIADPFGKKYIEVIPERGYQLELLLIKRKASYSLARSSVKYTPSYRIDKEFSSPEESEIYISQVPRRGGRISS